MVHSVTNDGGLSVGGFMHANNRYQAVVVVDSNKHDGQLVKTQVGSFLTATY